MFSPSLCSHHMFSPIYFISLSPFTPSPTHCKHQRSRFEQSIKDRSYLLTRLFARYLLPPDTVLQGFADWQPRRPLLYELVMRLYITRYRVQGDSRCRWSLTTGWRGDRWRNQNWYRVLQPWGDISRRRRQLLIEEVNGPHSSLPCSPTLGARIPGTSDYMLRTLRALVKCTWVLISNNNLGIFEMYPQHLSNMEPLRKSW